VWFPHRHAQRLTLSARTPAALQTLWPSASGVQTGSCSSSLLPRCASVPEMSPYRAASMQPPGGPLLAQQGSWAAAGLPPSRAALLPSATSMPAFAEPCGAGGGCGADLMPGAAVAALLAEEGMWGCDLDAMLLPADVERDLLEPLL